MNSPKGQAANKGKAISKGPAFAPLVQYQFAEQTHRIQGHIASSTPGYAVGDPVSVLVHPDRPAEGRIDSFAEKWLAPLAFLGGGLLFGLVAIGMVIARRRANAQ